MASSIILGGPTLLQAYGAKGLSTPIVNLDVKVCPSQSTVNQILESFK